MFRHRISTFACLLAGLLVLSTSQAVAADSVAIKSVFSQLVATPALADPSVIVLDEKTGNVVFESNSKSPRKPASVIKLLSATAAYTYLTPSDTFTTALYEGVDKKSVLIRGSFDPWISYDPKVAAKMGRVSLRAIEYKAINALKALHGGSSNHTTIYYSKLYPEDLADIAKYIKSHHTSVAMKQINEAQVDSLAGNQIYSAASPTLEKILDWTLTWSDNVLAERIARLASVAAGNPFNDAGVETTFKSLLTQYGISTSQLVIKDASGLSKENRITAEQIARLLMVLYHDQKFAPLIAGLPIGGVTGTLEHRFIETAPSAVGLVRAKTGTLNGTTNLAGYVQSGDHEYIFVIIADRHSKSYSVTKKVRATVDAILGRIATPLLPELVPALSQNETLTATP